MHTAVARAARVGDTAPVEMRHVIRSLHIATTDAGALKAALSFLTGRYAGAVVFSVGDRAVNVWAAAGRIADPDGLQRFIVRLDESSILGFLARESALLQGAAGESRADRQLAQLVAGAEGAFELSLSIAVSGRVRYIVCGFEPVLSRDQATRELELLGSELSRALSRLDRDRAFREAPTPQEITPDELRHPSARGGPRPPCDRSSA
jgi:hypothetical protein